MGRKPVSREARVVMRAVLKVAREVLDAEGLKEVRPRPSWGHWATHFKPRRRNSLAGSVVSFGSQMIDVHLTGVGSDRVQTEMRQFGWDHKYGQSPAVELAAVVLHEIAHAMVHRTGGRHYGVVHGAEFYRAFRLLVQTRLKETAKRLTELAEMPELLEEPDELRAAANERRPKQMFSGEFRAGDLVEFETPKAGVVRGKIIRRGTKRWTIRPMGMHSGYSKFFVPERMLKKVDVEVEEPKQPRPLEMIQPPKPMDEEKPFEVGDRVQVFTYGKWFDGEIVQIKKRHKTVTDCGRTVFAKLSQLRRK